MASGSNSKADAPARSLDRQFVLEEDEYTEALSHIIARDFFPSLVHLDATNNYLDALKSQDPARIQATVRRLEEINTPVTNRRSGTTVGATPTPYGGRGTYDTPLGTPWDSDRHSAGDGQGDEPLSKRRKLDTDMSLDGFQAKYTSEDNASFLEILDDENKKRKETYDWAYNAQKRVEEQRERLLEGRERLLIEPPQVTVTGVREKFRIEAPKPVGLITQGESEDVEGEKGKEVALVSVTKDEEVVDVMGPKKDTRAAGVDGWKFKARNALMFPPDADMSPHTSKSASGAPPDPRSIKHGNTRLPEQEESTSSGRSEPPSPTRSRIDAAIAGVPYKQSSPKSNGFGLVPAMPSPTPEELGTAAVKQLMTWGTLDATPRIISSDDPADVPEPSTPFRIAGPSSRERISHKLSANASKSLRAKAILLGSGKTSGISRTQTRGDMGPPTWTPKRAEVMGNLTPAAKRLLNRTMASRRSDAMEKTSNWQEGSSTKEKDLSKIRWTPTPGR
ncbi:hypothetical protein BDM02DRAFT_425286 [Thelephora ganbajun]|uniref:Uncharacterized protein n=1 Tax=Thelephora ganbajun TaxID=370292 RepID=A0ACB6ZPZ6_THEGA|nr:hypothetical protein BDM02DRAFT_425286 [Thelephora ganbajun]